LRECGGSQSWQDDGYIIRAINCVPTYDISMALVGATSSPTVKCNAIEGNITNTLDFATLHRGYKKGLVKLNATFQWLWLVSCGFTATI
jgi:hypothetical protein